MDAQRRPGRPQLLSVLWAHRNALILGAAVGLVIGLAIALLKPVTFTSTATLLFPSAPSSGLLSLAGGGGGDVSIPLLGGALMVPQPGSSAGTASILLQGRQAREHVLQALLVPTDGTQDSLNLSQTWRLDRRETLKRLQEDLLCRLGKQGELYVGFRDQSPERAYRIATAFVDELKARSAQLGLNPAEDSAKFLEQQIADTEASLSNSQAAMLAFQRKHHIVSLPDQAQALAQQYTRMQSDLIAAKLDASASMRQAKLLSSSVEHLIRASIDPVPGARDSNLLGPLYEQVTRAESELALLRLRYTADHPDVQEKAAQLAEVRRQLQAEIERQLAALKSGNAPATGNVVIQATIHQARVAGLQTALEQVQHDVERLPEQQARYARLSAELQANIDALKLFRDELAKARILEKSRGPMFIVADPPQVPLEKDASGRALLVLFGLLLGLGFGAIAPYRDWVQQQYAALDAEEYDRAAVAGK